MNININKEDSSINDFLLIFDGMKQRPNRLVIHDTLSGKEFSEIIQKNIISEKMDSNFLTEFLPSDDDYIINRKVLKQLNDDLWISYVEINKNSESFLVNEVCFYYKDIKQEKELDEIFSEISECVVDYDDDNFDKVNTLSLNNNLLELEPLIINHEIDVDNMYTSKVIKEVDKLVKSIKKKNKGLSIFTGEKGLGKTNMCKYLASKVDRMSIFIPNNMVEQTINNPEFRNFIKKYDKCLLIVDDCEFLYNPVYGKMNYFTNNILQLIDGFISDHLNLQVILVFNDIEENLDDNLLDCNNLLNIIEFELLDAETASDLSKSIGNNKKFKEESRLIDVFNSKKNKNKKGDLGLK
jgi:hypothetical protein